MDGRIFFTDRNPIVEKFGRRKYVEKIRIFCVSISTSVNVCMCVLIVIAATAFVTIIITRVRFDGGETFVHMEVAISYT